jgi:hypothetical protein
MATALGAQEVIQGQLNFVAGGTINKGDLVKHSTDASGTILQCSAITDVCIGVALSAASSGQGVAVQNLGIGICKAKNAITEGDQLMPSTTAGQPSTAAGATAVSIGVALQTVADGEFVAVMLAVPGVKRPPNS